MTKILLVEDDKSLREIYGVRLLAEGYDIVSAGDGEEALAMAIKDRPDLILSDVMMPKISGFDMLDILRSTTETRGIKVIMMTALSSEDQRQRGVALGADRYLVKSQVGIEDVVRTVHEVLADAPLSPGSSPAPQSQPQPQASQPAPAPTPRPTQAGYTPAPRPETPAPAPVHPPAPTYETPGQVPAPAPIAPAPTQMPEPAPAAQTSTLPQPTAPFSTPRPGSLADRVIEPLPSAPTTESSIDDLMKQALEEHSAEAEAPQTESLPSYEETPRSEAPVSSIPPAPTPPSPSFTPPTMPQPPQPPNTGV